MHNFRAAEKGPFSKSPSCKKFLKFYYPFRGPTFRYVGFLLYLFSVMVFVFSPEHLLWVSFASFPVSQHESCITSWRQLLPSL